MNKIFLIGSLILTLVSCKMKEDKQTSISSIDTGSTNGSSVFKLEKKSSYMLIRDNLYYDTDGNLYLKAINREDLDNGTQYDVWLTTVYCDTCFTPTDDGFKDLATLNDFVDTTSFHLDHTDSKQGGDIYADKNNTYFHKWMADGGTIILLEK